MWTAKEARETAENSISESTKKQLLEVEGCIMNAAQNGEMKCYCTEYLSSQAISKLNELGYTVSDKSSQRDGISFLICW